MAKTIEKGESTSYEIKIKKHRRKVYMIRTIIVLILLVIAIYAINSFVNKKFNGYVVINQLERADSNTVQYTSYGEDLLKYSRDGISAIDGRGKLLWNGTFEMKEPSVDICEGYVAVGDIGSKSVYLFDPKGTSKKLEMFNTVLQVSVASQGVVAILLENEDTNFIKIINPLTGAEILDIRTLVEKDGYPIDISISNDGKKLVSSYLSISNGMLTSHVVFRNFDVVGKNEINNLVGSMKYEQIIIPKVEFINNDTVCAYGEDRLVIYSMKQKPKVIYEEELEGEIKNIFSSDKYIGMVLLGQSGIEKDKMIIYNLEGKKVLEKDIDFDYNKIVISGKEVVLYSDLDCRVIKISGEMKFEYTFAKNIDYIFPINDYNKYFLIDDTYIEEIKLVEVKD